PLAYAMLIGAILAVARAWGGRRAGWLLLALLVVQWLDLRPGILARGVEAAAVPREVPPRLHDPFWTEALQHYRQFRCVPATNIGPGWDTLGVLAVHAGRPTDCLYLARVDDAALAALRARVATILASGAYEPATLYLLRDEESLARARASHDPARDAILHLDGHWILAPGWHARQPGKAARN
ncbi:MAG TPA: hypothetical protein VD970_12020, partial [Acetobacteraceae bacterium]|nr:hypothetical protein [Acetobacteraceae bacterium]